MENDRQDSTPEPKVDVAGSWNKQHALFLAEYRELIEREGPALEELRTF